MGNKKLIERARSTEAEAKQQMEELRAKAPYYRVENKLRMIAEVIHNTERKVGSAGYEFDWTRGKVTVKELTDTHIALKGGHEIPFSMLSRDVHEIASLVRFYAAKEKLMEEKFQLGERARETRELQRAFGQAERALRGNSLKQDGHKENILRLEKIVQNRKERLR